MLCEIHLMSQLFHFFLTRHCVRAVPSESMRLNMLTKNDTPYKIIQRIKINHNRRQKKKCSIWTNQPNGINDDDQEPNQMDRNEVNEEAWGNLNEINFGEYLLDWNDWNGNEYGIHNYWCVAVGFVAHDERASSKCLYAEPHSARVSMGLKHVFVSVKWKIIFQTVSVIILVVGACRMQCH